MKPSALSPSPRAEVTASSSTKNALLGPTNPGAGFLGPEDWLGLAGSFRVTTREMYVAIPLY